MECGLIFVNPQPEPEVLREYYPKDYSVPNPSHYKEHFWLRKKSWKSIFYRERIDGIGGELMYLEVAKTLLMVTIGSSAGVRWLYCDVRPLGMTVHE